MVKLIWTDRAIDDLSDIGNYIAETSEKYAKLMVKKIYDRTNINVVSLRKFRQTLRGF